jgi:DnaJ-class molecular chaperone
MDIHTRENCPACGGSGKDENGHSDSVPRGIVLCATCEGKGYVESWRPATEVFAPAQNVPAGPAD